MFSFRAMLSRDVANMPASPRERTAVTDAESILTAEVSADGIPRDAAAYGITVMATDSDIMILRTDIISSRRHPGISRP